LVDHLREFGKVLVELIAALYHSGRFCQVERHIRMLRYQLTNGWSQSGINVKRSFGA